MPAPELAQLRAALRLALARRGEAAPQPAVPRRRVAVEREGIRIDPRRLRRYLECTGGAGLAEAPSVSPVFPAMWGTGMTLELLAACEIGMPRGGVVHLGGELVQLRPLRPGDQLRCRLELDRAEPDPGGTRLTLVARNWNAAGQLCTEETTRLLLRSGERGGRPSRREGAGEAEPAWEEVAEWRLRGGHGRRYARVSGDWNPIHLWRWSSRLFGFDRPILHGFCIEALVAHELVSRRLGGDPAALRRLEITFRAPLLLPAHARLQVAPADCGGHGGRFRVLLAGARRPVAEGKWTGKDG